MSLFKLAMIFRIQSLLALSLLGPVIFCVLFFAVQPAVAENIAAVKSVDIKPYKRAIKGFKEVLPTKITEYVLRYKGSNGEDREKLLLLVDGKKTDLLFTLGTEALDLVKNNFTDVPVIFSFVLNPAQVIGGEWINNNSNLRGISMNIPSVEQFKILQQAVPEAKRIGVVYDPLKTGHQVAEAKIAAEQLGMRIVPQKISSSEEAINAIDRLEGQVDAIWMVPDTTAITRESMKYILLFSFRNGLPLIGLSEKYVKSGALFALSFDSEDIGRQAGEIAGKILDGETRSTLGIYAPRLLKLSINMKTAEKIGLNVPESLMQMADKIY
ncbi:MAG: ABC transporter substrate-binding protein [Candidatus Polarisedimenticolaceae bacterium]|nr:ABC transporter substrate-binding protein [Candidatus Polarisedimenticolaceae bacterium]